MTHTFPQKTDFDRDTIKKIANEFVTLNKSRNITNLCDVIANIGGEIKRRDFLNGVHDDASLVIQGRGKFTIFVPAHGDMYSHFWNISHELGHYILHYISKKMDNHKKPVKAFRIDDPTADKEADMFATILLDRYHMNYAKQDANRTGVRLDETLPMDDLRILFSEENLTIH